MTAIIGPLGRLVATVPPPTETGGQGLERFVSNLFRGLALLLRHSQE